MLAARTIVLNLHLPSHCLVQAAATFDDPVQMQALPGAAPPQTVGGGTGDRAMAGTHGSKPSSQKVEAALAALREAFAKRGCDTLLRLGKKFHVMDDDGSSGLSFEEVHIFRDS